MKEKYFTEKNLKKKASKILKEVEKISKIKNLEFNPQNSALLVLDMQKFFLDKNSHAFIPSAPSIIPVINNLIQKYYRKKLPVIFTKHINNLHNALNMKKWWKDLIRENSEFSEIISEIDILKGIIIKKSQYDAFYKTDLEKILKRKGIKQVVITGVMTHLCCETTARSAFIRGFDVFFVIDGSATYNYKFHLSSVLNLSHGFAVPVLSEGIIKKL